ncbi:DMT family transporter [Pseudahrensia aquimaris]|uniref:DMT family transporter n=1 Tax=Pseudahrensia aquimaris TaxID=744461 RepID=A0ABW3FHP6_9HYPH
MSNSGQTASSSGGLSANALGAVFMMLSMAGFVLNDTFMKLVSKDVTIFQAILIRGLFAVTLLYFIARWRNAFTLPLGLRATMTNPAFVARTCAEATATFLFLEALFNLPIANVTAVLQLLPLTITLGAALFFGEAVGWRRYGAILVGFFGVLLILQPGTSEFSIYSIYALGAVVAVTVRDLATRKMPDEIPSLFVSFVTAIVIAIVGAAGSLGKPWEAIAPVHVLSLSLAAAAIALGYICAVLTMRNGEVSFVSPFRYSIMIWALLIGYFVFSDVPTLLELLGASIVVASGLFTFYRERRTKLRQVAPR